ncbi:hypothetical protein HYDPIDRAFT_26431 [Hydnomerulius pinastri MD-312]|nr:hypothetical protein HYDPIDRAFT_26431 [Hydnomerulius pinastri MD-312]
MTSSSMSNVGGSVADAQVFFNYGIVAIAVVWAYEFIITFDEELTFIRGSRWTYVKVVYLLCRYLTFPVVTLNIPHYLQLGLSLETCNRYFAFNSFACGMIIATADSLFLVRNYALWGGRRTARFIMGFNFLACVIPITVLLTIFNASVTGTTSCRTVHQSRSIIWVFVIVVIGETVALITTMYRTAKHNASLEGQSRLLNILIHQRIIYYCFSLAFSVVVILTNALLPPPYPDLFSNLQAVLHAVLVTRMHRELWMADRRKCPETPTEITLSAIHFVDPTPLMSSA